MPKDTIGIGIVGTGFGVRVQAPVWANTPGVKVTAVCSRDPQRARKIADRLGVQHAVTDARELARLPDVDLVSVTTPPHEHYEGVMAAVDAGKHVLCEKPFALDAKQAREMLDAARKRKVLHFVNHEFRMLPARQAIHRFVQEGSLGTPINVVFTSFSDFVPANQKRMGKWWFEADKGGGWLGASASHSLDTMRFLFGDIVGVGAQLDTVLRTPTSVAGPVTSTVDDTCFLTLRFASGALGACLYGAAVAAGAGPARLEAYGSKATLVMEGDRLLMAKPGSPLSEVTLDKPDLPLGMSDLHYIPFALWTRRIVDAVRHGKQIRPDFEDGLRCQQVLDAARGSAAERRWVDLPMQGREP